MNWTRQYEDAADAEYARCLARPVEGLLDDLRRGRTGDYFQIWRVLGERGSAAQVAWPLYDFLLSDRPYLDRYHCANALLRVLDCTAFEAVQLSANWSTRPEALLQLRARVEAAAGAGPER